GTHITSVGTGSPEKIELEPALLGRADKLVADRVFQTERYGNLHHAIAAGAVTRDKVYAELGDLAAGRLPGRESASEITVADLTGVGVQDGAIAPLVSAQKAPNGVSLVSRCPIVLTMRQPPDMVPSPMAAPQATMTHAGTTPASVRCSAGTGKSVRTRCSATSNPTMIPIVFWASLEPWPKEYAAAEPSCSTRKTRSTLRGKERRSAHDSATVSTSASVRPITGAMTMKARVEIHFPGKSSAVKPAFATAAPP